MCDESLVQALPQTDPAQKIRQGETDSAQNRSRIRRWTRKLTLSPQATRFLGPVLTWSRASLSSRVSLSLAQATWPAVVGSAPPEKDLPSILKQELCLCDCTRV
jgi:hypothetical protein